MTEKRFQVTQTTLGSGIYDFQAEDTLCESYDEDAYNQVVKKLNELTEENQRLTNKLNQTALELVDGVISQGKAVEISEMSYHEFLDYRAKNGKPMELQL